MITNLFTIGCSTLSTKDFIDLVEKYQLNVIADVRSVPYSRFTPQFNADTVRSSLKAAGLIYLPFGDEFGARRKEREVYVDGTVSFERVSRLPIFRKGIERIADGLAKGYRIGLLCTERDPIDCHRFSLVAANIRSLAGIESNHIHATGEVETTNSIEQRMLRTLNLHPELFSDNSRSHIEKAYRLLEDRVAFSEMEHQE